MSVSTSVSINGSRTDLVFGARYRVRYGRDDRMLIDAKLVERARNGDLVFDELETLADPKRVRVRPSTIDAIFGSGVEEPADVEPCYCSGPWSKVDPADRPETALAREHPLGTLGCTMLSREPENRPLADAVRQYGPSLIRARREDESASDYLRVLERGLGAGSYRRWIATEPGQRALEDAAREDQERRRASEATLRASSEKLSSRTSLSKARRRIRPSEAIEPDLADEAILVVERRLRGLADPPDVIIAGAPEPNRLPRGICPKCDQVVALRKGGLVREHRRAGAPDGPVCDGSGLPAVEPSSSTPNGVRRVRDGDGWKVVPDTHNHIWKCSTCKRRTRAAFCENGHARVAAPAGARAEDRR